MRRMIHESQSRVRAMAIIHGILYESGDLARINLEDYISKLADSLVRMYGADPERVVLDIDAANVTLGIDDTVPCGLVVNELLSNSLKYAFRDGRKGGIRIHASSEDNREIVLVVQDDGIGIPADLDIRKTETMGMSLVVSLV